MKTNKMESLFFEYSAYRTPLEDDDGYRTIYNLEEFEKVDVYAIGVVTDTTELEWVGEMEFEALQIDFETLQDELLARGVTTRLSEEQKNFIQKSYDEMVSTYFRNCWVDYEDSFIGPDHKVFNFVEPDHFIHYFRNKLEDDIDDYERRERNGWDNSDDIEPITSHQFSHIDAVVNALPDVETPVDEEYEYPPTYIGKVSKKRELSDSEMEALNRIFKGVFFEYMDAAVAHQMTKDGYDEDEISELISTPIDDALTIADSLLSRSEWSVNNQAKNDEVYKDVLKDILSDF